MERLRPHSEKFPFRGDYWRRLVRSRLPPDGDAALGAINPTAGRDEKDAGARAARRRKNLGDAFKGEEIPDDQVMPGFGERWGRPKREQMAIQIPRAGVDAMTEKIVRGLVYREDRRFIEEPYTIETYLDGAGADVAKKKMIEKAGKAYKREPGLEITVQ